MKNKKFLIVILLLIPVLVAGGVVSYFLFIKDNDKDNNNQVGNVELISISCTQTPHGEISPKTTSKLIKGESYECTFKADTGYHIKSISLNGVSTDIENQKLSEYKYTFDNLTEVSNIVSAVFAENLRVNELSVSRNGSGIVWTGVNNLVLSDDEKNDFYFCEGDVAKFEIVSQEIRLTGHFGSYYGISNIKINDINYSYNDIVTGKISGVSITSQEDKYYLNVNLNKSLDIFIQFNFAVRFDYGTGVDYLNVDVGALSELENAFNSIVADINNISSDFIGWKISGDPLDTLYDTFDKIKNITYNTNYANISFEAVYE